MYDLCPLCLKKGINTKIKAIWVNFDEAVWMCEKPDCPHPFLGPEDITFIPKKVGEKWNWEYQEYRTVKERVGSIPISTELSLYTPPVTPICDASTKDSVESEITGNNTGSTSISSINKSPIDSYAPRSSAETRSSSLEKVGKTEKLKTIENMPCEKRSKIVDIAVPSLPSIFDIDGDTNSKISIKLCPDFALPEQHAPSSSVLNTKNSAAAINCTGTVLKNSRPQKFRRNEQKTVEPIVRRTVKGIPLVRSVSNTNIDLQRFESSKLVKIEKPVTPPKEKPPDEIAARLFSPTKHSTTITVEGTPITLSYDLADFEIKTEEKIPTTSTPIRKIQTSLSPNKVEESCQEIPKKKFKSLPMRRHREGQNGKAFEKFNFSTLKKVAKNSNTTEVPVVVKIMSPKLEKITNSTDGCSNASDSLMKTETSNSINLVVNNSIVTESTAVDFNGLLDDVLLDSYQNATQNLEDDWLESFFNDNT